MAGRGGIMARNERRRGPGRWLRTAARTAGFAALLGISAGAAQDPAPFRRPATDAEEMTLALSALPAGMREAAGVYVLRPSGYVKVRESRSGVHCLLSRSRPDTQEPICWDREGSETILPLALAKAEWRAAGATDAEIEKREREGFAAGRFLAPRKGGISYMLSSENWVHNGQKVVKYFPHVMFYAPYATNADIGSDGKDPYAPWVLNPGTPHAYIIIVTRSPGS
jgi:hypothetical protein